MTDKNKGRSYLGRPHFQVVYRHGEKNICPGCARSQWWVGRISAECAFCHTALPMAEQTNSNFVMYNRNRPD